MSVKELERNKKYKITIPIGYNGTKRINHYETFYGKKSEAELREAELKASIKNHTFVENDKISFKNYFEKWITFKKDSWTPRTYDSHRARITNIINQLGHIKLQELNVQILEEFYKWLNNEKHYSDKSIREHYVLINEALKKAVIWGYIVYNPNTRIEPPKITKTEIQCYSEDDIEKLFEALETEPIKYKALIILALDSGARRSEITGLKWTDIDFKNHTMDINKITQYTKELGIYEKSTKNLTSNRRIFLSDYTIAILKEYQKSQMQKKLKLGTKWNNPNNRIFTTETGSDMHPDTPSQIFEKIIKKHNLKRITFHGLRHTSISLQIAKGIQPQIISKRAGHSNVTTTHTIYSHFFTNEFEAVANTMNTIFEDKINKIK